MSVDARHIVLLVFAAMGLVKAVCGVIGPASVKRFLSWWVNAGPVAHKAAGVVCMALASLVLVVVLLLQELIDWVLMLLAVAAAWAGSLYFREQDIRKIVESVVLNRSDTFLRVISLAGGALYGVLLWIALSEML